uniref:Uncharacterized protein n=1 Tax=Arundo donax TaxID=35708 RepID=A0A0A9C545_ARUDO
MGTKPCSFVGSGVIIRPPKICISCFQCREIVM